MKLTKKIMIAVAAIAAAMAFTSCDGLGKDDFYGTWATEYDYADATDGGKKVAVTMYFDGRSESLFGGDSKFWQYKTRKTEDGTSTKVETFWFGSYKLADNSNYTEGTLILKYRYGINLVKLNSEVITGELLSKIAMNDEEALATGNQALGTEFTKSTDFFSYLSSLQNKGWNQVDDNDKCSDVEYFDFELGGQSLLAGYTTMAATEKKTVNEQTGATVNDSGCSWEVPSRSFNRTAMTSDLASAIEFLKNAAESTEE